jgi:hypothetical protein
VTVFRVGQVLAVGTVEVVLPGLVDVRTHRGALIRHTAAQLARLLEAERQVRPEVLVPAQRAVTGRVNPAGGRNT